MDSNIAVGQRATDEVTIVQTNRNSVQRPGLSVIRHTHAERDIAPVLQTSRAAELSSVATDGQILNSASRCADTGSGIAKGQTPGYPSMMRLGGRWSAR